MRLSEIALIVFLITVYFGTVYTTNDIDSSRTTIHGIMSLERGNTKYYDGSPVFQSGAEIKLILFGDNLTEDSKISITNKPDSCEYKYEAQVLEAFEGNHTGVISVHINSDKRSPEPWYLCVKLNDSWIHEGTNKFKTFYAENPFLVIPFWVTIMFGIFCICISSLMSGLNLGLMALDLSELTVISRSNLGKEKLYAKQILTVRKQGNFLLCSILFTCTIFNAILTVIIDSEIGNTETVIIVTLIIVIFCEIIPQAVCSRIPLLIGAKTIYLTKGFMVITAPFSYPLGKLLDYILGKEIVKYPKEKLKELIKIAELPKGEAAIIAGTLEMSKTKVGDIMTLLNDVYKLPITGVLDYPTVGNIMFSGYSRIPIYEGETSNIVHVLLTKDLALIDPSGKIPIITLCEYSSSTYKYLPYETTVDVAFRCLKEVGIHLAFITMKNENNKDVTVGLVTLEDIIEEMIQEEIFDETDVFVDNRSKRRIANSVRRRNIGMMLKKYGAHSITITPQMKAATCHYLSSGVEAFNKNKITEEILRKLLNLNLVERINAQNGLEDANIYVKGKEVDFFVMILEGKVQVSIGNEDLLFEGGPFHCFGHLALADNVEKDGNINESGYFTPDYSVTAISEVFYFKIERTFYMAALKASGLVSVNEDLIKHKKKFYIFLSMIEKADLEDECSRKSDGS